MWQTCQYIAFNESPGFWNNHTSTFSNPTTSSPPDRHHCGKAHRDKIPLIHFLSGEVKLCKQPTWGWISAMKGRLPLVLLSLWASNIVSRELILRRKLQLWTLQGGKENTWTGSPFILEMARALKSGKCMLLNFQKESIMCPRWLWLSGGDALMAVTSKTRGLTKTLFTPIFLLLEKQLSVDKNKYFTTKSNCRIYSKVDSDDVFSPSNVSKK